MSQRLPSLEPTHRIRQLRGSVAGANRTVDQDWRRVGKVGRIVPVSPTVLQSGPYRFFFFSSDRNEPTHVHVKRDRKLAKFWLSPIRLEYNYGFTPTELNRITAIVREHEAELLKAWHDYFNRSD
jgi:hypothetical protein